MVTTDTTDFSPYYKSYSKLVLSELCDDYKRRVKDYAEYISDVAAFEHIIENIRISLDRFDRDGVMLKNYRALAERYQFASTPQYAHMGYSHLQKSAEGTYQYLFTRLHKEGVVPREKIVSIIGYFNNSAVLWDPLYNDEGQYTGFTTETGYGTSDYWKEYFRGIKRLKKARLSDLTLFRLNQPTSPYRQPKPDLVEIKMLFSKSNSKRVKGRATTDFVDYALLISDSPNNRPLDILEAKLLEEKP